VKEIVVLSGKGGTGKTTMMGSLAVIVPDKIIADCDVDAADLHLLLEPEIKEKHDFVSGVEAEVIPDKCTGCGTCVELCKWEAITLDETAYVEPLDCEGCGVCAHFCPEEAIMLKDKHCGYWFKSETPYGPFVHAQLGIGEENSGKLVSLVKNKAKEWGEELGKKWVIVDGAPGIGCPVIASLSGAHAVLLITEPTPSGLHDMGRVLELTAHFKIPTFVCVNKWDLHPEGAKAIEDHCDKNNVAVIGHLPYDPCVVKAMVQGKPVVSLFADSPVSVAIKEVWQKLSSILS